MPGYATLVAAVVVTGLGAAAFHPEAYKTTSAVAGDRKATAISWFSLGGNIGIAIGPPLVTVLIAAFGLTGSVGMLLPSLIVAGLLTLALPLLSPAGPAGARGGAASAAARTMPGAMAILVLVVAIRSWTQLGFTTFVPFYYIDHLKADPRVVGTLLFVFLGAGATGTVVVGPMADRFGPRRVLAGVFLLVTPLAALFLAVSGGLFAFVLLGAVGFVLVSSFTMAVVLGQAYLPRHQGLASGLIAGFAFGAGGMGATALGWVADRWGLPSALWISTLLPLAGFATALLLPEPKSR
jgi:FSR family fosmidomycin resistance protein-like MFS transporter